MSHKIEIFKKVDSISNKDRIFSDYNDDISFNFDDDFDNNYNDPLYEIEFLFRMIGSGDYKTYYTLKPYEMTRKEISLFHMKQEFLNKNNHLYLNDCFLQFMFFVVMKDLVLDHNYLMKRKIANLITRKIVQLANSDEIFRQKVEYIRISILDEQNYPEQADHWDLKYADEKCCKDEHIQKLLFNCTTVHDVSSDFLYSNMLAS